MSKIFTYEKKLDMKEGGRAIAQGVRPRGDILSRTETAVKGEGKMLQETLSRTETVIITNV
jgi:hypothetical protein